MSVREVASAEFYEISRRSTGRLLVTQFTATWCGPCKRVAPQYEALARRTPDVEFIKVYEHNSRDAIIASGVRSFPTFHFYLGGAKVDECRGANIAQVEHKVVLHKEAASNSTAGGPVMVKLHFERQKPRQSGEGFILVAQEAELEVHPSEGLEIFKFQVLSITDIEADDQVLTAGDSTTPMATDSDLAAGLRATGGGVYGNYPVIRVSKRAAPAAKAARKAEAKKGASEATAASSPDWEACCSRTYFGRKPVIQPAYVIREESLLPEVELTALQKKKAGPEAILVVCKACAENCFVPGRAEHSPAISTSAPFLCQSKEACGRGYGADLFSGRADAGAEILPPGSSALAAAEASAASAAEEVYYAARAQPRTGTENEEMADMRRRIASGMRGVLAYEDASLQTKALAVLPPADGEGSIAQRGAEMAAAGGFSEVEGLARALLSWFKRDFFKWTNKPPCSNCDARGGSMEEKGLCAPTPHEAASKASRVELYGCKGCGAEGGFPRYNDPAKLLETRNGRCGEWANCFTLMCRAVGLEARHVQDWTDHVWTEVWIPSKNKWVHADPCENKLDKPLMYEQGWNKRLSYVLAFDKHGAVDVTRRYTRRWIQVLSRRNKVPEIWLAGVLTSHKAMTSEAIAARLAEEQLELKGFESMGFDGDSLDMEEKEGRQSGDAKWVASRGEDGVGGGGGASASSVGPGQPTASESSVEASCLVGVPLGVTSAAGGGCLRLCVAAVVEPSGDSSVLVGGATVSRLSGRGRSALCAAAVSATTGVLLAAKSFLLGSGADCAEVTAWLAGLADGTVVAIAAGGGGGAAGKASNEILEPMLAEAIAGLVGQGAENEPTPQDSRSFAVVGWKGTGERAWARRQRRSEGAGRCAVYAELALAAVGQAPAGPRQVELQDKLCLCPLRSEPVGDGTPETTTLPARGVCRRAGEVTVSVGPVVDLVNCPGWTTVLQAPDVVDGANGVATPAPAAWMVTAVYPAVGGTHEDTEAFDDGPAGCPAFAMGGSPFAGFDGGDPFLPVGRVREIVAWSGDSVNGVQVVYDVSGDTVWGPKRMGDHGLYRQSTLKLDVEGGEVITEVSVKAGSIVESLHIRTSKGKEKKWGGEGGHLQRTWQVPTGSSFLGFHGGVGGHLHSLGMTLAEKGGTAVLEAGRDGNSSLLTSLVKTNLYTSDRVMRACAQLLAFNTPTRAPSGAAAGATSVPQSRLATTADVVIALETMRKYADNLLASPLDPKVSRIRLANGFFDRKVGRLAGGGGVIRAMGFELADEGGRMHYIFRRGGAGGGLDGLRRARQTLSDFAEALKR